MRIPQMDLLTPSHTFSYLLIPFRQLSHTFSYLPHILIPFRTFSEIIYVCGPQSALKSYEADKGVKQARGVV